MLLLLVDKALVQGVHLLRGVHLPGVKVLKEMAMVEGLQLPGVFHPEVNLLIQEAHLNQIQMLM